MLTTLADEAEGGPLTTSGIAGLGGGVKSRGGGLDLDRGTFDGEGFAAGHHGEVLQGVFEVGGRLHRGLTTMPGPVFTSTAQVLLDPRGSELTVDPPWKTKALQAVCATVKAIGLQPMGGRLKVVSNVDIGRGFGSSSSDVTAAVRSVLAALGQRMPQKQIAEVAVEAEAAADPLMFDRMVLFAHREGSLLEDFGVPMCPVEVLGVSLGYPEVDTLELRSARYSAWEIECFRALRGLLRRALISRDLVAIGRVATASARLNQRFLPVPRFDDLVVTANEVGAVGMQISHSGNIGGMLFEPRDPDLERRISLARERFLEHGLAENWRFGVGSENVS